MSDIWSARKSQADRKVGSVPLTSPMTTVDLGQLPTSAIVHLTCP
jgi:hypothetical protein